MHPGLEGGVAAKPRQPAPGANERVLGDIRRQFSIVDQSHCQGEHPVLVPSYQFLKSVSIAGLRPADQFCLFSGFDCRVVHRVTDRL